MIMGVHAARYGNMLGHECVCDSIHAVLIAACYRILRSHVHLVGYGRGFFHTTVVCNFPTCRLKAFRALAIIMPPTGFSKCLPLHHDRRRPGY